MTLNIWAENDLWATGPDVGIANKQTIPAAIRQDGFVAGVPIVAQHVNQLFNELTINQRDDWFNRLTQLKSVPIVTSAGFTSSVVKPAVFPGIDGTSTEIVLGPQVGDVFRVAKGQNEMAFDSTQTAPANLVTSTFAGVHCALPNLDGNMLIIGERNGGGNAVIYQRLLNAGVTWTQRTPAPTASEVLAITTTPNNEYWIIDITGAVWRLTSTATTIVAATNPLSSSGRLEYNSAMASDSSGNVYWLGLLSGDEAVAVRDSAGVTTNTGTLANPGPQAAIGGHAGSTVLLAEKKAGTSDTIQIRTVNSQLTFQLLAEIVEPRELPTADIDVRLRLLNEPGSDVFVLLAATKEATGVFEQFIAVYASPDRGVTWIGPSYIPKSSSVNSSVLNSIQLVNGRLWSFVARGATAMQVYASDGI